MSSPLAFGLTFDALYDFEKLESLHQYFLGFLNKNNPPLWHAYLESFEKDHLDSTVLCDLAIYLEQFITHLFNLSKELGKLQERYQQTSLIASVKRDFVQRIALKEYPLNHIMFENSYTIECPFQNPDDDLAIAKEIQTYQKDPETYADQLSKAKKYAAFRVYRNQNQTIKDSSLFIAPEKIDYADLLPKWISKNESIQSTQVINRDGFENQKRHHRSTLENQQKAGVEASYCIHCHHQNKDSCSKGLKNKIDPHVFEKNPLDQSLTGCPLKQKISEMNSLLHMSHPLAALAVAMLDNPMIPATGDRICNDCSKACIFQKQTPVDIPSIESQILADILNLPYGVEIYSLLTRWNPLNHKLPLPKPPTLKNVLVVGMGPSGFTLAHYLLREGHTVLGMDALKIDPLQADEIGRDKDGKKVPIRAIRSFKEWQENLSKRPFSGFGGVCAYGITARFNKAYLYLIRLVLERNAHFRLLGSLRFGGIITKESAFKLGFDHIAFCSGGGSPIRLQELEHTEVKGIKQASDFLMSLHLGEPYHEKSLMNLLIRRPIIVIGGGLTAIDTATEALAYYPQQVMLFKKRYDRLCEIYSKDEVEKSWTDDDRQIAEEFLKDASIFTSLKASDDPKALQQYLQDEKAVTILYRSDLTSSKSYRLNDQEIRKALEEGIIFTPHQDLKEILVDDHRNLIKIKTNADLFPCKTLLIAIGSHTNTTTDDDQTADLQENNDKKISFFGDRDPSFRGSVVKAMASAKNGYQNISTFLDQLPNEQKRQYSSSFFSSLLPRFETIVQSCEKIFDRCYQIKIKAPEAAFQFQVGHLFKLQTYVTAESDVFAMEGIALNAVDVDRENGTLTFIVYEAGASSAQCAKMKPGDFVALMGPTGHPLHIPKNKKMLLITTHIHAAVFWMIAEKLKQAGCQITWVATFKDSTSRFHAEKMERYADQILWCYNRHLDTDGSSHRPTDLVYYGTLEDAIRHHKDALNLTSIDEIWAHGSNTLNHYIEKALRTTWADCIHPSTPVYGSVNAPMQCMMKGICGQCLHVHHLPNGVKKYVYSCAHTHQNLRTANYDVLTDRMTQNSLFEKISRIQHRPPL